LSVVAPTYRDDTRIQEVFHRMLDGWMDPIAYAAGFAPDAIHIGTGGRLDRGREEIIDGHAGVLSTWGRASSKTGRIDRLQFLTADIALLTVYGNITFGANPPANQIETVTAQNVGGSWSLVACQYTP
jgi:uncharacterized protein (TIGR02246 family)